MRLARIQLDTTPESACCASGTFEVPTCARWLLLSPGKQFQLKALLRGPAVQTEGKGCSSDKQLEMEPARKDRGPRDWFCEELSLELKTN